MNTTKEQLLPCADDRTIVVDGFTVRFSQPDELYLQSHKWRVFKLQLQASISGRTKFFHREIMSPPAWLDVDHRNGDSLDNRRSNLRICTRQVNMLNSSAPCGKNHYRGVSHDYKHGKLRWYARIYFSDHPIHLGWHKTEESAARAYDIGSAAIAEYLNCGPLQSRFRTPTDQVNV